VLIVEDDNVSYEYIKLMLKRISILEPLHAKNGKEAVEMIEKFPDIDIVLLDIKMPIMDGYEAFEKMKKINPKSSILAQTAYAFNEDKDRILAMGFDGYIAKPYSIQAFMSAINEVAKKHLT
jgi:CheY-like chemotaxis protein